MSFDSNRLNDDMTPTCAPTCRTDFHGADIQIDLGYKYEPYAYEYVTAPKFITHRDSRGKVTEPPVHSHRDGIRVGCTFVTNTALEHLYKLHTQFLKGQDTKEHQ